MKDDRSNHGCCCSCHEEERSYLMEEECADKKEFFIELADLAWAEVLKEKIKEHILKTQNDKMTELAKIVAEGNSQRWKHQMEKERVESEFDEKLCRFFGEPKRL